MVKRGGGHGGMGVMEDWGCSGSTIGSEFHSILILSSFGNQKNICKERVQ